MQLLGYLMLIRLMKPIRKMELTPLFLVKEDGPNLGIVNK
jgi:hypothetical protein